MAHSTINHSPILSRAEWLTVRKALLAREKELTHARDAVNAERRRLPMVRIDKAYVFEGPNGKASLLDLFEGRRQRIVYHFMFDPSWDEGCPSCSFVVDNIGHLAHLHARKTALALVSRAPLARIERFRRRMGWTVPGYSSFGSDFNYDFHITYDEAVAPVEYNYLGKAELLRKGETWFTKDVVENKFPESVSLREGHLNPVLAPEGEILSFAWPKESIQRKGHPTAAKALALLACQAGSAEGASLPLCRRGASLRRPVGLIRLANCDAQRG